MKRTRILLVIVWCLACLLLGAFTGWLQHGPLERAEQWRDLAKVDHAAIVEAVRETFWLLNGGPPSLRPEVMSRHYPEVRTIVDAERRAWLLTGRYVPLERLSLFSPRVNAALDELKKKVQEYSSSEEEANAGDDPYFFQVGTLKADEAVAELLLTEDASSYVLVVYKHREPFFQLLYQDWPDTYRVQYDTIVVFGPGMWERALYAPETLPKVKDTVAARLLDESKDYEKTLRFHTEYLERSREILSRIEQKQ